MQAAIVNALVANLTSLWGAVDLAELRRTLGPVVDAAVAVVQSRRASAALAAQAYYRAFRVAEGEGPIEVRTADATGLEYVRGLLLGGALAGFRDARSRGLSGAKVVEAGLVNVVGTGRKVVADGARETILGAVLEDPKAVGYQRVTDGSPCAFCAMIASRGVIAYSEGSAGFKAHGHCGCTAEPAFEGSEIIPLNAKFRDAWRESTAGRGGNDALNAFRRHLSRDQVPATG